MHPSVHCSTTYNSQVMEATKMSINKWMGKEDVVYLYNGIPLSHKKEWNNAICSNMNGPRYYHTKWSKLEKDKYHIAYMCNLKKKYKWTYIQNRNRPIDIENKFMVTKGERGGGINLEFGINKYKLLYIK